MAHRLRGPAIAFLLLLVPCEAPARDILRCAELYGRLSTLPQIIGNTAETRRYAEELGRSNGDIRQLRIEMRRTGCAGGSIVALGADNLARCEELKTKLEELETGRATLTEQRNQARQLLRTSGERGEILAAIRTNACIPSDIEDAERLRRGERRHPGDALSAPRTRPSMGPFMGNPARIPVTALPPSPPPQPERPYDPTRKVRMVGPQFLPEESIDFTRPRPDSRSPTRDP